MSGINFTCDVCGREVYGCSFVNGMKFCAKCYQETFGASKDWQLLDKDKIIAEQQQLIAELEEQLKNAPKYTVYSKVFFIDDCEQTIKEDFVEQITINHRDGIYYELVNNFLFEENELFATEEEAQAKLKELTAKNV